MAWIDPYTGMLVEGGGSIMGDVMGRRNFSVVGYDDYGNEIRGAAPRQLPRRPIAMAGGGMVPVHQPDWRAGQLAPGVIAPDEGLVSLPLNGPAGNTFSATTTRIVFTGQLQKPFRGERLIVQTVRTGTSAVGRLLSQLFVGTDLQQADIDPLDIEPLGATGAFGVRLTMKPAQPGVLIRFPTILSSALTATDTILATFQLLGRITH